MIRINPVRIAFYVIRWPWWFKWGSQGPCLEYLKFCTRWPFLEFKISTVIYPFTKRTNYCTSFESYCNDLLNFLCFKEHFHRRWKWREANNNTIDIVLLCKSITVLQRAEDKQLTTANVFWCNDDLVFNIYKKKSGNLM